MIIDPPKQREAETSFQASPPPSHSQSAENVASYASVPVPQHLHLDPGPRQRLPRKITPHGLCLGLASLSIFISVMSALSFFQTVLQRYQRPHLDMRVYQDPKSGITSGPAVVKPLIGDKGIFGTRFDIVATVWIREGAYISRRDVGSESAVPDRETAERVLFSQTVFSNVSLQDTRVRAAVNFEVPTTIFKNHVLHDTDLRASFALIPHSPSLLDHAVNYSTINDKALLLPPIRSYPADFTPSLIDDIIDSYGISNRLLEFHPVPSRCRQKSGHAVEYPMDDGEDDDEEPGWSESFQMKDPKRAVGAPRRLHPQSTVDLPVLDFHPYVITRTYLRVVDMSLLYNRKVFDKEHKILKRRKLACTRNKIENEMSCQRSFVTHGNFETKIRVQYPDQKPDHEWAYAPYIATGEGAWGPKDLIPVPVNREECTTSPDGESNLLVQDDPFLNITWHLTYSGQEWVKGFYSDVYAETQQLNMTASEAEKVRAQWDYAYFQGLIGHPYRDDFHPQRQFALRWSGKILSVISRIMVAYYFHTLNTTVGLSVIGTTLYASAWIMDYILSGISHAAAEQHDTSQFLLHLLWRFIPQFTAFLMLKGAWRAEFDWSSQQTGGMWSSIPGIKFASPTHRERNSLRLECRISVVEKTMAFVCISLLLYTFQVHDYYIVQPLNPAPIHQIPHLEQHISTLRAIIVMPSFILGKLLQLFHNHCSQTFAGTSKKAVWVALLAMMMQLGSESEMLVGYLDVRDGLRLDAACVLVVLLVEVVQSWMFECVPSVDEEEDSR